MTHVSDNSFHEVNSTSSVSIIISSFLVSETTVSFSSFSQQDVNKKENKINNKINIFLKFLIIYWY